MPKLIMNHAIFIAVEVEVPEKCPGCGASFTDDSDTLREMDWSEEKLLGHLDVGDHGEDPFTPTDSEQGDEKVAAGWWCGDCGHEIATATTSHVPTTLPRKAAAKEAGRLAALALAPEKG